MTSNRGMRGPDTASPARPGAGRARGRPPATAQEVEGLRAEGERLRLELAEAKDTLRAIQSGEVDALVVRTPGGEHIFTLKNAYEPYRVLVEHMQQGAASLTADGLIVYANARFAELFGVPLERLVGASIYGIVGDQYRPVVESLLAGTAGARDAEMVLTVAGDREMHALLHVTAMPEAMRCAVVTDLTERVHQQQILASREWLRVTLASIGDAVLSCDTEGRITFINPVAEGLTGWSEREALGQPIHLVLRTVDEVTHEPLPLEDLLGPVLREGAAPLTLHAALLDRDGREVCIEDSAAPIRDASGGLAGAVLVFHDATEKRRAERALLESQARLAEANRAKDEFLATLSHELRTPMNAILGWAQMLTTRSVDEATRERGLQSIVRNAHAQMQLVTDILDISRIVSGRLRLDVRPVDLVAVVYAALDSIQPAADAKGVALTTSIAAESTVVPGDPDRLQQVVWNVLSNAVKFTPPGGRVDLSLQRTETDFAIRVRDSGVGINPAFLPHVFDRFAQADSSSRRPHSGLGLGLSIVRHLTELHGGTVEAQSEGEGKGATFSIVLPIRAVLRRPAGGPGARPAPPGRRASALNGIRVLVVDDEADARELVAAVLADCGASVTTATSAAEGLRQLGQHRFDVLLADIGMPQEDGYDLIRNVRRLPAELGPTIPAAALTAYGRVDDAETALASGFQVHVTKPVSPDTLVATVARLVGRGTG